VFEEGSTVPIGDDETFDDEFPVPSLKKQTEKSIIGGLRKTRFM
jgi:hypothetical protein